MRIRASSHRHACVFAVLASTLCRRTTGCAHCISAAVDPLTLCLQGESLAEQHVTRPRATPLYLTVTCTGCAHQGLGIAPSDPRAVIRELRPGRG